MIYIFNNHNIVRGRSYIFKANYRVHAEAKFREHMGIIFGAKLRDIMFPDMYYFDFPNGRVEIFKIHQFSEEDLDRIRWF